MSMKRTYLKSYVYFRFEFVVTDDVQKPQCIFCSKVLGNGSMKLSVLKAHFSLSHSKHVYFDHKSLLDKRARFCAAGALPKLGFCSEDKAGLEASYQVAYRIAKEKKPHTIGEQLVKPCAIDMVELVCGVEQKRKLALNHVLFKVFCDKMGSEHTVLLYHTDIGWLSRGLVFSPVFELCEEIETFFRKRKSLLSRHFDDSKFIEALAYLTDIFSSLNQLNMQMQGKSITIVDARDKF